MGNISSLEPALVVMPSAEKAANRYEFKNLQALWFVPLVMYFDFESFLKPVYSCPDNPSRSSTRVVQNHEACGYSLAVIDHGNSQPYFCDYDNSDQCMKKFLNHLHQLAREIYDQKRRFPHFHGSQESLTKENRSTCWICCIKFTNEHKKLTFFGKVSGMSHEKCNLARRTVNFTPVIGHNIYILIRTWPIEKNLKKENCLGPMFCMEEKLQLQKRIWNMQGKFLESLNVRTWSIITSCISSVIHYCLLASLKSFVK